MVNRVLSVFVFLVVFLYDANGQGNGSGVSMPSALIKNPSMAGVEGDGTLRMSYLSLYPGNGYNLNYLQMSFDGFFPTIHGGAAFFLTNDKRGGVINDLRGGMSYSYHFRAGDDIYVSAGLSASVLHRGFNMDGAILPDQIDPVGMAVLPSNEVLTDRGVTRTDISSGLLVMFSDYYVGLAVSHLNRPNLSADNKEGGKLDMNLLLQFGGDVVIGGGKELSLKPVAAIEMDKDRMSVVLGSSIGGALLSANALFLYDNTKNMDMQAGLSTTLNGVTFYYNYQFNILSISNMHPLSVQHNVGLSIGLYSVDKRKSINTIKFSNI